MSRRIEGNAGTHVEQLPAMSTLQSEEDILAAYAAQLERGERPSADEIRDVKKLSNPELRRPFEEKLRESIRRSIAHVREPLKRGSSDYEGYEKYLEVSNFKDNMTTNYLWGSFCRNLPPMEATLLGVVECREIGFEVCEEEKLTVKELEKMLKRLETKYLRIRNKQLQAEIKDLQKERERFFQ